MKRILVVDDSAVVRSSATEALAGAGYDVTVRATFEELVEHGVEGYDLILMDVNMPELYGDEVASALRYERGLATPIYLFSSCDADELAGLARRAGLDGFISKLEGMAALVARVRTILR